MEDDITCVSTNRLRLGIVAFLFAFNFGILKLFEDVKQMNFFQSLFYVNANIFTYIAMSIFVLYILFMSLNYLNFKKWEQKYILVFFDIGIAFTMVIIYLTVALGIGIFVERKFLFIPEWVFYVYLVGVVLAGWHIFKQIFPYSELIQEVKNKTKNKRKRKK